MTNIEDYNQKMNKTIEVFNKELGTLRTGRANSNMLDLIKVDVYGQKMPINQIGTITTPEPRTLNIQVWDLNNVALIDAAIKSEQLSLAKSLLAERVAIHANSYGSWKKYADVCEKLGDEKSTIAAQAEVSRLSAELSQPV